MKSSNKDDYGNDNNEKEEVINGDDYNVVDNDDEPTT